jgi:hypothetical protein
MFYKTATSQDLHARMVAEMFLLHFKSETKSKLARCCLNGKIDEYPSSI